MPGAIIITDQPSGAGLGSAGIARQDLWQSQVLNLDVTTLGNSSFLWEILDKPVGSTATLTTPTTQTCAFTPDLIGTYRVRLTTNGGGSGNVQTLVFRCRYTSTGTLANRGWAYPAVGERLNEANYSGNTRGWKQVQDTILEDIRTNFSTGGGGGAASGNQLLMGPERNFLAGTYNGLGFVRTTTLVDGAVPATDGYAGTDLVFSEKRLFMTGNDGTDGKLYSLEPGGLHYGEEFDFTSLNAAMVNPSAVIGVGTDSNFFNLISISAGGLISNYLYETIHCTPADYNLDWPSGAEDWSGARACYIFRPLETPSGEGVTVQIFWTAPLEDKLYKGNIFWDVSDPTSTTFAGQTPKGICADANNNVWVSFTGSGVIRKYEAGDVGAGLFLTQVGADIALVDVVEMLCDGKYIWALSTAGVSGKVHQLDLEGTLVRTIDVNDSVKTFNIAITERSRMCFDGMLLWVTAGQATFNIHPDGGVALFKENYGAGYEIRGITCDKNRNVYFAIYNGAIMFIQKWTPTTGGPLVRTTREITWLLNDSSMPAVFDAIDMSDLNGVRYKTYELDIKAQSLSPVGFAYWKKNVTLEDTGTMALIGSEIDMIPPKMNATAIAQGLNVTFSYGASFKLTLDCGTAPNSVYWTVVMTEIIAYDGSWSL
jgi:hypothetical protein